MPQPRVAIIMGSKSDWDCMRQASDMLTELNVPHENRILSAHRTPDALAAYVKDAEARGVCVFIAGAGGAAHLGGVIASQTLLPVLGVPMQSKALSLSFRCRKVFLLPAWPLVMLVQPMPVCWPPKFCLYQMPNYVAA